MSTRLRIALLLAIALAAGSARGEPWRFCGEDYWFTAEPPAGWEITSDLEAADLSLVFHPIGAPPGGRDDAAAIAVVMPLGSGSLEPRSVDLDRVLTDWIRLVNAFGAPAEIVDWDMAHSSRPTRSAIVRGDRGRLYVSIVDAGSGRGHAFIVFLGQRGEPASPGTLRTFRTILASLHFDPTRICEPGPGDEVVERRIDAPGAAAAPAPGAPDAFPIERALSGCATLQELFVPVSCRPARVAGRDVWVVRFEDAQESAGTYLGRFRDRVATPWCWAARDRSDAPALLFAIPDSASLREYSCESSGWGRPVPAPLQADGPPPRE